MEKERRKRKKKEWEKERENKLWSFRWKENKRKYGWPSYKAPTLQPPPPIMKTIQVRRTRHAGHCWRSRDELISDVLLWTSTYGRAKAGRPARTYIQQLCEDTGCSPEDLPEAMNDREKWWERVRDIHVSGTTWWWWWYFIKKNKERWVLSLLFQFLIIFIRPLSDNRSECNNTLEFKLSMMLQSSILTTKPHKLPFICKV